MYTFELEVGNPALVDTIVSSDFRILVAAQDAGFDHRYFGFGEVFHGLCTLYFGKMENGRSMLLVADDEQR